MQPLPDLVVRAQSMALRIGFRESCIDEVGRLLSILVRQVRCGRVGEIGTGCGVGTAWMATALAPSAELYTAEIDPTRAEVARSARGGEKTSERRGLPPASQTCLPDAIITPQRAFHQDPEGTGFLKGVDP